MSETTGLLNGSMLRREMGLISTVEMAVHPTGRIWSSRSTTSMLRYIFGLLLLAMGLHTTWQALRAGPLVLRYGHGNRMNIPKPKWYHRGLWLCIGLVFLIGAVVFLSGQASHAIGALIGMVLSAWASFTFFRSSITGAPPLYSKGSFERSLHFVAGIIFGSLAIGIALKLGGKW
jgi:uncharacterized membrane protein YfcA